MKEEVEKTGGSAKYNWDTVRKYSPMCLFFMLTITTYVVRNSKEVSLSSSHLLHVKIHIASDPKFDNTPEFIIAEIKKSNTKLLIACVYRRPPVLSPHALFEKLSAFLPFY